MALGGKRTAAVWLSVTAGGLGLIITALAVANYAAERDLIRQLEQDPRVLAGHERLTRWTIEVHQADLEQELLKLAKVADLKEAILKGDRLELRDQLEPPLNRLRKGPLQISRLTLYTPSGDANLRAHALDSYGENVLEARPLIAETARARRIVKGLESEGGRPHLWAATPIYHGGRVIGILEIGSSLAPIIRAIKMVTGGEVAVLLGGNPFSTIESSAPQLFAQVTRRLSPKNSVTRQVFVMDERTYATTLIPLKDFAGSEIGCLAILSDATAIAGILQKNNAITFVIGVLGFALAAALLGTLLLRRDRS
jgi:hypothetical protein